MNNFKLCPLWILLLCIFASAFRALAGDSFADLTRPPDSVSAVLQSNTIELRPDGAGVWRGGDVMVRARKHRDGVDLELTSPTLPVKHVLVRWQAALPKNWKYLGDAWERAYGDLEWKPLDGQRVMPWYFLASNGKVTHGYGVKTGPSALCHWTADADGITLHADVRCGGEGVLLGRRTLPVCTVICRAGRQDETPFAAARAFCRAMCPKPRLPKQPVYGFNDWYCTYGGDTAERFLTNAAGIASLSAPGGNCPFAVVDDGWEEKAEQAAGSTLWVRVNPNFSRTLDMPAFARRIKERGARPGLWYRPLIATPDAPASWRLAREPKSLDPTVAAVREHIRETVARFPQWGFELIKHDFTTFDLLGKWGFEMTNEMTADGWTFSDRSRTTAEIIRDLYRDIRSAAGNRTLIEGCNTIGHLAAGIFELQRIGDDTSGRQWNRTRKMGVNSLAFRAPQQGAFFAVDADCAGQFRSNSLPWGKNRQWLDLLSHSGTVCFVSFDKDAIGSDQQGALQAALAAAARKQPLGEPLDWTEKRIPENWLLDGKTLQFAW
jgi:alpha-galactosidase